MREGKVAVAYDPPGNINSGRIECKGSNYDAAVGISIVVWLTVVLSDLVRLAALLLEGGSK